MNPLIKPADSLQLSKGCFKQDRVISVAIYTEHCIYACMLQPPPFKCMQSGFLKAIVFHSAPPKQSHRCIVSTCSCFLKQIAVISTYAAGFLSKSQLSQKESPLYGT